MAARRQPAKLAEPEPQAEAPAEDVPDVEKHPAAPSPRETPTDNVIDYVGYARELNEIAEAAAGVTPDDDDETRAAKLHEWNVNGGLLKALEDGLYDVPSKVRGGSLRDGMQHEDPAPISVSVLAAGDDVRGVCKNVGDLNTLDIVPVPNYQPWDEGVTARVDGSRVRWTGEAWESTD